MPDSLLVGLMSGTSMDAIDAALVKLNPQGDTELVDCLEAPLDPDLRARVSELSHPADNEIEKLGALDRKLGQLFARATLDLLAKAGIDRQRIKAIGSHGQTLRHRPPSAPGIDGQAYTLQIGDPNTIAELTGITTVADFRRRDVAAGGEGAPLVPAFHAAAFAHPHERRAIVNIGGIANVSLLQGSHTLGFDTGPGNTLLDHWIELQRGERYDPNGSWAAEGQVHQELLQQLLQHPFLKLRAPKSTGKEAFNLAWLQAQPVPLGDIDPQDVQATLAEFTAVSITRALEAQAGLEAVYVCGGGAANGDLMRRLYRQLDPIRLGTTSELGLDPAWVEAAAFAWLAHRTLAGLPGNAAEVTGARGPRILGAIFPGENKSA